MLNVECRDDIDPGVTDDLNVLVALLSIGLGRIRVREFIDEAHYRPPAYDRLSVHFLDDHALVLDPLPWKDVQPRHHLRCGGAPVRLDEPNDDVLAVVPPTLTLAEHRVGLADTWKGAQV